MLKKWKSCQKQKVITPDIRFILFTDVPFQPPLLAIQAPSLVRSGSRFDFRDAFANNSHRGAANMATAKICPNDHTASMGSVMSGAYAARYHSLNATMKQQKTISLRVTSRIVSAYQENRINLTLHAKNPKVAKVSVWDVKGVRKTTGRPQTGRIRLHLAHVQSPNRCHVRTTQSLNGVHTLSRQLFVKSSQ